MRALPDLWRASVTSPKAPRQISKALLATFIRRTKSQGVIFGTMFVSCSKQGRADRGPYVCLQPKLLDIANIVFQELFILGLLDLADPVFGDAHVKAVFDHVDQ